MARAGLVALAGLLTACAAKPIIPAKPDPIPFSCSVECRASCGISVQWSPTDPDSPEAWAELVQQVVIPMRQQVAVCDRRRQACVECLGDLAEAGVIE